VHLAGRIGGARPPLLEALGGVAGKGVLFGVTLGAVAPWALPGLAALSGRHRVAALGVVALGALGTQLVAPDVPAVAGEGVVTSAVRVLFLLAGLGLVVAFVRAWRAETGGLDGVRAALGGPRRAGRGLDPGARYALTLGVMAASGAAFVVALAPFMAVRHVLLVLPAMMLLLARRHGAWLGRPEGRGLFAAGTAATLVLGVGLAVSDRRWAESYRDAAHRFAPSTERGRTFFVGHWGWQWHAAEAGLVRYEPGVTRLSEGDVVIRPRLVSQPPLRPEDAARLRPMAPHVVPAAFWDRLRTMTARHGYYLVGEELPWTVSAAPVEVFERARVGPSSGAR
jgi:hypothetical protein